MTFFYLGNDAKRSLKNVPIRHPEENFARIQGKDPLDLTSFRQGDASLLREAREDGVLRELRRESMEGTVQILQGFPFEGFLIATEGLSS